LLRAGALIDVMDALPHELRSRGHEVAVVLPYYREIRDNPAFKEEDTGVTVDVRVGDKTYIAEYLQEEGRDLVNKTELEEFLRGVDELRETADRIEARLGRLEQRVKGPA